MFILNNDDLSIYATRGDIVFFTVSAEDNGEAYTFKVGDVVRVKIFGKKDAESVVLEKDFPITEKTENVEILLTAEDTKIGGVISKPRDYWYEIELNPLTKPQTIIGYDENGPKVFKLFPEGADIPAYVPTPEDIPFIDSELDLTSPRPVENQAVARAVVQLKAAFAKTDKTSNDTAAALSLERARIDNIVAQNAVKVSKTLDYVAAFDEQKKPIIDATITSDGVHATIKINFREAEAFYSSLNMFIIPDECRPISTGLIHTEGRLSYGIRYDTEHKYYYLYAYITDEDYYIAVPSEAGVINITYALENYELKDIRIGANGETYGTAGEAVRKKSELIDSLSIATLGYTERAILWENGNLQFGSATNRIVTQVCVAKGDIVLIAPEGYEIALGVYEGTEGAYTKVFDSGWHTGTYETDYGAGTIYKVVVRQIDDADIAPTIGSLVSVREYFGKDNHGKRIKDTEDGISRIEARFSETRNLFTGVADWINADINGKAGGVLEPKVDNKEYAAVPTYMRIKSGDHVISWASIKSSLISLYLHFYDADKNHIKYQALYNVSSGGYKTFTSPENAAYFRVSVYSTASESWTDNIPLNLQVEEGYVPTEYIGARVIDHNYIDIADIAKALPASENMGKPFTSATIRSIAHRGEPIHAPQCTAPAYVAAKKLGFNIAENDLYNTADGKLVMWHDTTLARLGDGMRDISGFPMYTDGKTVYYYNPSSGVVYTYDNGYIESGVDVSDLVKMKGSDYSVQSLTLAVLKRIDFGEYMGKAFVGTQILTFAEWVQLCKWLGLEIYIDKKITLTSSIVAEMVQTVSRLGMLNHTSWFVWDMAEVSLIRSKVPNARIVWLDAPTESKIVSRASLLKDGAVVFNPHTLELTEENIASALEAGYEVECWNVDYASYGFNTTEDIFNEIRRVCYLGVGGITLDKYSVEDAILASI